MIRTPSRLSPEDDPVGNSKIRHWRSCLRQIRRGGEAPLGATFRSDSVGKPRDY